MGKKVFALLLTLVMLFSFTGISMAAPTVILDGKQLSFDVPPIIENGRTLIPVRTILESLGAAVEWDDYTKTVTAKKSGTTVRIQIGNNVVQKNDESIALEVPAKIVNGRTLVPLRFVSEALGAKVDWEDSSQTITILDPKLRIGINLELSGGVGYYGSNTRDGINLAIYQINAGGGVLGKQLMAVTKDSKSIPDESLNASMALVREGVVAQIGPLTSGNVTACSPLLMENQIPLLAPAATAPNVTVDYEGKTLDYIFRVCFIDPLQGTLMAQFAADELGAKKAAIYKDASSDYSTSLAEYFKKTFQAKGGQVICEEEFVMNDRDFRAGLTKIKSQNPDFIYVPGYYMEVAPLIKQARELGIKVAIGGCDGWDSPQIVKDAGEEALNNTYFINHYSSQDKDPKVVDFIAAYKAIYNEEADAFAALGYDAVQILKKAIENAGVADPVKIKDALANMKDFEGVTGKIRFYEQHNPIKSGVVIEFIDGNQVMKTRVYPE